MYILPSFISTGDKKNYFQTKIYEQEYITVNYNRPNPNNPTG